MVDTGYANGEEDMAAHANLDMDILIGGFIGNSSHQDGHTAVSLCVGPIEHTITVDTPDMKGVSRSSQDGFGYTSVLLSDGSVGMNGIRIDNEASIPERGMQADCRICQEEDYVNNLETPCACSGSVKYAHRQCVQRWCNEKGDTVCEICCQSYKNGYEIPRRPPKCDVLPLQVNGELRNTPTTTAAYTRADASFGVADLIFMSLLPIRHVLIRAAAGTVEDTLAFHVLFFLIYSFFLFFHALFFLRGIFFLLPCFAMAQLMVVFQRRRLRQETAARVATPLQRADQARGRHSVVLPRHAPPRELP